MFVCQQTGSTSRWTVGNLPGDTGTLDQISLTVDSSQAGTVLTIQDDPSFGFEIHILSSSSPSSVISELRVTAVRQLNGTTVECAGVRVYTSTIQIASVGKSHAHAISLKQPLDTEVGILEPMSQMWLHAGFCVALKLTSFVRQGHYNL